MVVINSRGSAPSSYNSTTISLIKETIKNHANNYFSATLNTEKDLVNVLNAQYNYESSSDPNNVGPELHNQESRNYLQSSAIQNILKTGTPQQVANVSQGLFVMGLGQVSAHYLVRKGAPSGQGEIERLRSDLSGIVCVDPGGDIYGSFLGPNNISKQVLASMIVLEGKWKQVSSYGYYYVVRGDRNHNFFSSKLAAAIGAYLGLGIADKNGTTPVAYANNIVGGPSYIKANGSSPYVAQSDTRPVSVIATGPSTNGINRSKITTAGCA